MSELNLLPHVAKFQAAKMQLRAKSKKITVGVGIAWLSITVIVFIAWFVFQYRVSIEQRRYDRAVEEFQSFKNEITLTQQLKFKAKLVSQILTDRFEYSSVFKLIEDLFSSSISVDKTEITDSSTISITGTAAEIDSISEVEGKVKAAKNKEIEGLSDILIKTLTYNKKGWDFDLEVILQ